MELTGKDKHRYYPYRYDFYHSYLRVYRVGGEGEEGKEVLIRNYQVLKDDQDTDGCGITNRGNLFKYFFALRYYKLSI